LTPPGGNRKLTIRMVRTSRLGRSGNGSVVQVPKLFLRALGWRKGDDLAVCLAGEYLIVTRIDVAQLLPDRPVAELVADALKRKGA
jgi:antitoxin component of MazEF toxin-antitoxin module